VFGDTKVADEDEVKENWEHLKIKESKKTVLSGVPGITSCTDKGKPHPGQGKGGRL
jgi:uncharacterized protein YabN with tetrapyrrole methylase and pyrophosphatase domain